MYARLIVPAVLGTLLLSTAVLAAGSSTTPKAAMQKDTEGFQIAAMRPAERCTALQKQFDSALKTHGPAADISNARMLRGDGGKLCSKGEYYQGIDQLERALKELGVGPKM